jgi:hypothetical protein
MGYNRALIQSPGLPIPAPAASGMLGNVTINERTEDTNVTIVTSEMQRGGVNFTGFSAGRNITTPTGAQITAAFPEMDVGDGFMFMVSIQDAFAGTYVAGDANVLLSGRATTPASSWSMIVVTRLPDSGANRQYRWRVM